MYNTKTFRQTSFNINNSVEGETLEEKLERAMNNGEAMKGERALIYTEKKEGSLPGHNIRTDRFEIAVEMKEKMQKSDYVKTEKANLQIVKDETTQATKEQ